MDSARKILLIIPSSIIFFLIVPVLSLIFGRHIDWVLRITPLELGTTGTLFSLGLILVGGYYVIESIRILLVRGGGIPLGDVFPEDQSTELITEGVYGQTRNPMLFGYLLCLIATGVLMKSISVTFIIPGGFIILWTIWLKTREEPALEDRFGDPYREYKAKTPYLIPRLRRNS